MSNAIIIVNGATVTLDEVLAEGLLPLPPLATTTVVSTMTDVSGVSTAQVTSFSFERNGIQGLLVGDLTVETRVTSTWDPVNAVYVTEIASTAVTGVVNSIEYASIGVIVQTPGSGTGTPLDDLFGLTGRDFMTDGTTLSLQGGLPMPGASTDATEILRVGAAPRFDGEGGKDLIDISSRPSSNEPVILEYDAWSDLEGVSTNPAFAPTAETINGLRPYDLIDLRALGAIVWVDDLVGSDSALDRWTIMPGAEAGTFTILFARAGSAVSTHRIDLAPAATPSGWDVATLREIVLVQGDGRRLLEGKSSSDIYTDGGTDAALRTSDGSDIIFSRAGDDVVSAGDGADVIHAGDGNDILAGGGGADVMIGGAGNDIYVVEDADDLVTEVDAATGRDWGGIDMVHAAVSWTLDDGVENLAFNGSADLDGVGNDLANRVIGNVGANRLEGRGGNDTLLGLAGDDRLIGGDGNDRLDGGAGIDVMFGGAGNDLYTVDHVGDVVSESLDGVSDDGGNDTVRASVSVTLSDSIEALELTGSEALIGIGNGGDNRLEGNAGANRLEGRAGADRLFGHDGDDRLVGGAGADILTGGVGADTFVFDGVVGNGLDRVVDFQSGIDRIEIRGADYGLTPGALDDARFAETGVAIGRGVAQFVFDPARGTLWFDADGVGGQRAVALAQFGPKTLLSHTDFIIV